MRHISSAMLYLLKLLQQVFRLFFKIIFEYLRPSFKFCWLWIFRWIKLYSQSCSMWDKPGWLNWFSQFLCEGLSSFNPKGFYYWYGWPHSLCEGRTSFFTALISGKFCRFLCFRLVLLHSVFFFFFHYQSPSSSLSTVFDSISSSIDEVLSVNPSSNMFVFGNFNFHHKDWLTYSGASICSTMAFPPLGNSHHVVVSVSHADWDGLCDHLTDVPWEDIYVSACAAAIVHRNHFFQFVLAE